MCPTFWDSTLVLAPTHLHPNRGKKALRQRFNWLLYFSSLLTRSGLTSSELCFRNETASERLLNESRRIGRLGRRKSWPHRGDRPRMLAQPGVFLKEPYGLTDVAGAPPVEHAILRALRR